MADGLPVTGIQKPSVRKNIPSPLRLDPDLLAGWVGGIGRINRRKNGKRKGDDDLRRRAVIGIIRPVMPFLAPIAMPAIPAIAGKSWSAKAQS